MQKLFDDVYDDYVRQEDNDRLQRKLEVSNAIRFAVVAACAGIIFLGMAAWWAGSCSGLTNSGMVSCGAPQRTVLALGAPAMLLVAAIWAFLRTYRVWRNNGAWWGWQGAGWCLFMLMSGTLAIGFPPIAGLALPGG